MLRGAIDLVQSDRIGGWIYSDVGEVGDRTVLAYVGGQCVGAGRVDLLREDLRAAGLGDGRLGFSFGISLEDPTDLPRVVVKLDGSDLALLQPSATVAKAELFQPSLANLERVDWMRQKGMLAPSEVSFLKYLQQLSAFDYSLVQARGQGAAKSELADVRATAQNLFDLVSLRRADLRETELTLRHAEEIALAVFTEGGNPFSIVAIHAAEPGVVAVVEGSHEDPAKNVNFDGAIDYHFGPDRLLLLDLNARFRFPDGKARTVRLFSAS
jgi:hypothetical protein